VTVRLAAIALALVLAATARAAAAPAIEVRASRGAGGIVPAGGIDVVELEVISGADVPVDATLEIDGRRHRVALPARGRARLALGRRVPAGIGSLPAVAIGGDASLTVPAARVVHRPVIVVADDAAAALARVEPWRREQQLGDPVALAPEALPDRWQALAGAGAIVLDRGRDRLAAGPARLVARHLAAGGQVCTLAGSIDCERGPQVPVPRSRVQASSAALPRALGAIGLGLAVALLGAAAAPRRRRAVLGAAAIAIAALIAALWSPPASLELRGVRVAGADEDWVAAELGVAETGPLPRLDGDLWLEPAGAGSTLAPLDDSGFTGRPAAAGSYRVRGFTAPGTAWAQRLAEAP
jgi:hypothetical protein